MRMRLAEKLERMLDTTLLSAATESCGSKGARKPKRGVFGVNSDACADCSVTLRRRMSVAGGGGGVECSNPYMQKVHSPTEVLSRGQIGSYLRDDAKGGGRGGGTSSTDDTQ